MNTGTRNSEVTLQCLPGNRTRSLTALAARATLICTLALTLAPLPSPAGGQLEGARIELHSGHILEGNLRHIQPNLFLIQTADVLYEVRGDEIAAVNGTPGLPEQLRSSDRLLRSEHYALVAPTGEVELWTHLLVINESGKVWTSVTSGALERELEMYRTMEVYDVCGHRLSHRIEPRRGSHLYNVIVDLEVPVAPGETVRLSRRFTDCERVHRDGDSFVYTFLGGFPEDRIYTRKVRLPRGAVIESVEPAPVSRFEHDGHPFVVWRRYYPRGDRTPLRIDYRLSASPPRR